MRQNGSFGMLVFFIIAGLGGALAFVVNGVAGNDAAIGIGVVAFVVAIIASSAIRVADQWDIPYYKTQIALMQEFEKDTKPSVRKWAKDHIEWFEARIARDQRQETHESVGIYD